ncbi:hypothetical protein OESDEN_00346 [Oesophagostomum dentatum]|uniref:Uncharacterized protein n=1 Tax=Oesophagostomum dentatum TaxID=61180 RepID=A0A0B1TR08_OESDE|nr:hypothetical protein OESDEN_00346 [Oesophagostomum dentatum]
MSIPTLQNIKKDICKSTMFMKKALMRECRRNARGEQLEEFIWKAKPCKFYGFYRIQRSTDARSLTANLLIA